MTTSGRSAVASNVRKTAYMPNDEEIAAWVARRLLPQPSCWDEVHVIAGKNPKPWPAADKTADPFAASFTPQELSHLISLRLPERSSVLATCENRQFVLPRG